jgi:hypothetical protein
MARSTWLRSLIRGVKQGAPRQPVRRRRAVPLMLEALEDRTTPTVIFKPAFGAETLQKTPNNDYNFQTLSSPTVYLIFWGTYWGKHRDQAKTLDADAQAVLASPYLSKLTQYNPAHNASYGKALYGNYWVDPSSNPSWPTYTDSQGNTVTSNAGDSNSASAIQAEVADAINNSSGVIPAPALGSTQLTSPIYVVVTDPKTAGSNGGYNLPATYNPFPGIPATATPINMISVGTSTGPNEDYFTLTFGHEIAERMSDPTGDNYGVEVTPPSGIPGNLNGGYSQIGDNEPEPANQPHYSYRVSALGRTVAVQPWWSTADQAFIVPDGNPQQVTLDPSPYWTVDSTGTANFSNQYDLTITGDQGVFLDYGITIDATASGTTVTLDTINLATGLIGNESFAFDGGRIRNITVAPGAGSHAVNVQEVAANQTVTIKDAGTDAVNVGKNGSLAGILGNVSIINGVPSGNNARVTLTLDDSKDGTRRVVTQNKGILDFYTITATNLGTVSYESSALTALNIDGGTARNLFAFLATAPYITTTLDTGYGSDNVDVRATSAPLVITSTASSPAPGQAQDTVLIGRVLFDPAGSLQGVFGAVSVSNRAGSTNLIVDDSADPNALNWTITGSSLTNDYYLGAPAAIHYGAGVRSLEVHGGRGRNTFLVLGTGPSTTIDAGKGTTAVTVGDAAHSLNAVSGLTVNGNGKTTLTVDDRNTHDVQVGDSFLHNNVAFNLQAADLTRTDRIGLVFPQPGDPVYTTDVRFNRVSALTVHGGDSGNTFDVQGVADGTAVALFGGAGFDAATFDDSANANTLSTTYAVTSTNVTRAGLDLPVGGVFPGHTASIDYHNMETLDVKGGTSGNDFQVLSTQNGTATTLDAGAGPDTVEVGDNLHNLNNVYNLAINGAGNTTVTVDDSGNGPTTTGGSVYIPELTQFSVQSGSSQQPPSGVLTRLATDLVFLPGLPPITQTFGSTITYQGLSGLTIDGGPFAQNFYQIDSTAGTGAGGVSVTAGGTDVVSVGEEHGGTLDPITTVTVQGNGRTILVLNDPGSAGHEEYDVYTGKITREPITSPPTSPTQTVTYSGLAGITVNGANASSNQYFALGTPAGTSVSLNAGSGGFNQFLAFDEFSPTDAPPATDNLLGPVAFHGHQTSDFGERVDSFAAAGHTFTLNAVGAVSTVQRDGAADLTYDGLSQMIVAVPPVGGNHVNVQSVAPGVFMNITLAGGDVAVVGSLAPLPSGTMAGIRGNVGFTSETPGAASVSLVDSSDLSPAPRVTIAPPPSATDPFSSITGLSGAPDLGVFLLLSPGSSVSVAAGVGDKTFALLGALPNIALRIDGGTNLDGSAGNNTLDYSGWNGNVTVTLQRGEATGVAGGISNIRNIIGSIGNDLLVGDANANVLTGGTGRNIIIGGGGLDQITGGGGDNLLIGGGTLYDGNATALDLLMQEWMQPSDFATRQNAIEMGLDLLAGTGIKLDATTLLPDGLANSLTPGPGNNWLIP